MSESFSPSPTAAIESMADLQRAHARMLAALNHEIRTPLTGILGMSDLLLESSLSGEQREFVQSTRVCAETLLESLSNALEYASVTAGDLQLSHSPFQLGEVIRAAVAGIQMRADARNLFIQLLSEPSGADAPDLVLGDAVRLRQVITTLLSHAIDVCIHDEITLAVSTFTVEADRQLVLSISVGDNGPDPAPSRLRRLFDPPDTAGYTQARLELGLPLAFQLVKAMGGNLEAEAIGGSGILFSFSLPMPLAELSLDAGSARPMSNAPQRPRILLVEDNDVAQRFMRTVMERKGCEVRLASSGAEAIEIVGSAGFDLILMDVQMPEMDGLECTRRLRAIAEGREVPIVACTANTSSEVRRSCAEAGMNDFLAKPVHTTELVEIIARYCRAS